MFTKLMHHWIAKHRGEGASLRGANLRRADLCRARLTGADLTDADLRQADLAEADLSHACLRRASLAGAYLRGANLEAAEMESADLEGADLIRANLREANLAAARLVHALYNTETRWPTGFDPQEHGAVWVPPFNPATYERVKRVILEQWYGSEKWSVGEKEITPTACLGSDIFWSDDGRSVEVFMALEEAFDVVLPDEEIERFITVADLVLYIDMKTRAPAPGRT